MRQVIHYAQLMNWKISKFQMYDYGSRKRNLKYYQVPSPPQYPIEQISCPIAFFYGRSDGMCSVADVETLANRIHTLVDVIEVQKKYFSHFDFMWGKDAQTDVYDRMLKLLEEAEVTQFSYIQHPINLNVKTSLFTRFRKKLSNLWSFWG